MPRKTQKTYYARQTVGYYSPPDLHGIAVNGLVRLAMHPSSPIGEYEPPSCITLTPNQAMAFAAWLSDTAENLRAKEAARIIRKNARAAEKAARLKDGDAK